ncbi:MAG: extracellular solute-binding protein, partial [Planctomycetia bacterium]|nr:extracellular solute-binding protein [Planctomycetia bacterium]
MARKRCPRGSTNSLYVLAAGSLVLVGALGYLLMSGGKKPTGHKATPERTTNTTQATTSNSESETSELLMYCAAGMRYPLEQIAAKYEAEYGVRINLQYGGSNTLLNQLEVNKTGDLFLAGDASYVRLAEEKGLTAEAFPLAVMKPVIAVKAGNPKNITAIADLVRDDVKVALGDPDAAAIGKTIRELLSASGHWAALESYVTQNGVFKPTVNEVAKAVKL